MKALNRQQRRGAILKFVILYFVTIIFIIIPFIFLGNFIDQQNKELNSKIGECRSDLDICRKQTKTPRKWDASLKEYYTEYYDIEQSLNVIKNDMVSSVEMDLDSWTPEIHKHFIVLIDNLQYLHNRLEIQNEELKDIIPE